MDKAYVKYVRYRASFRRRIRYMFASPAEVRFIQLMGGRVVVINWIKYPHTRFPLAIALSLGRTLRSEKFRREVRVGKYFVDFGNDLKRGIEIDGEQYHRDVVAEMDRDIYLRERGWRIKHIPAMKLWRDPNAVIRDVLQYFYE